MSRHLNYFVPYSGKPVTHEDHLTRAALVVFEMIPLTLEAFLGQIGAPGLSLLPPVEIAMQTRTATAPLDISAPEDAETLDAVSEARELVSVLLDPEGESGAGNVTMSSRGQRLDGALRFGPRLTVVIESKLHGGRGKYQQLNVNPHGFEFTQTRDVTIRWASLFDTWQTLVDRGLLGYTERRVLERFWEFASGSHGDLLPFNTLRRAAGNDARVLLRLRDLLQEASRIEATIGDGVARIYPGTRSLLLIELKQEDGCVRLQAFPGQQNPQARWIYDRVTDRADRLLALAEQDHWTIKPDPFVSAWRQRHWRWWYPGDGTLTRDGTLGDYVRFWKENLDWIGRWPREELDALWKWCLANGLAGPADRDEFREKLKKPKYPAVLLRPGLFVRHEWAWDEAEQLDEQGSLAGEVQDAINALLKVFDERPIGRPRTTRKLAG